MAKKCYDVECLLNSIRKLDEFDEEDRETSVEMLAYALYAMSQLIDDFDAKEYIQMTIECGAEKGIDVKPYTDEVLKKLSEIENNDESEEEAEHIENAIAGGLIQLLNLFFGSDEPEEISENEKEDSEAEDKSESDEMKPAEKLGFDIGKNFCDILTGFLKGFLETSDDSKK